MEPCNRARKEPSGAGAQRSSGLFAGAADVYGPGVSAWPQAAASTAQAASAAARVAIRVETLGETAGAAASGGSRLVRCAGSVHEQFLGELAMQITDASREVQRNGEQHYTQYRDQRQQRRVR
jgi:hypothetical protein